MAGKKIDRVKAESALEVVRESPTIALIVAAPAIVVFGVLWWLTGFGTALLVTLVVAGLAVVAKKVF
ncbi:hypothetical protein EGT67_08495 [Prescottella agglutinans]|uniref:Uncharacterized protein n=1 Tax=Prescottella agglutinans TaxID=1644129 RepID=A0A3S3ZX06_9NOCA|nr:hypothetical protein [Prescottella agglutinans]RVW10227.1 hypothetical protein EGT67_08495 [Prescottella agglutinans]